eukprot:m.228513 g.228513  ORF g.228513 m.228513 type:complete len:376 (+) comp15980_c0_seq2:243-1370(+)
MEPSKELQEQVKKHGFKLKGYLGSGAFSQVWKATWKEKSDEEVACKVYTRKFTNLAKAQLTAIAKTDYGVANKLKHRNIVETFGLIHDDNLTCVVIELCYGDLLNSVKPNTGLPADVGQPVLSDICAGLDYMHTKHNIVHLDIKAENILLADGAFGPVAKLADFDAVMPIGAVMSQVRGTQDIHPPEYLQPSASGYTITASADVWAVGYIAYLCLYGRYIWDSADSNDAKYQAFLSAPQEQFPNADGELVQVFSDIFNTDPDSRPTMAEIEERLCSNWSQWTCSAREQAQSKDNSGKTRKSKSGRSSSNDKFFRDFAKPSCGPDWGNVFRRRKLFELMTGYSTMGSSEMSCMPKPRTVRSESDKRQYRMYSESDD